MKETVIRLGLCPTRRDVFVRETAIEFSKKIRTQLVGYPIELIDIDDINEEGLLFSDKDIEPIIRRFRNTEIDALFIPHCNFGSENRIARVAAALKVPVLLWGPQDDAPDENGFRNRDSQCGLFASGKMLRRYNVPFTYLTNTPYDSQDFKVGFDKFLRVVSVVKAFKEICILQISTRPEAFGSVMCNESELLERFGVRCVPITLDDLVRTMNQEIEEKSEEFKAVCTQIIKISNEHSEPELSMVAGLKIAMRKLAEQNGCTAVAIQCWNALQNMTNIVPCLANALLTDDGLPVVCETDICGAITAIMTQAADFNRQPQFFADITVRHPENPNAELLWHCGNFPYSLAKDPSLAHAGRNRYNGDRYGIAEWQLKDGDLTIARFDGDHGNYTLLIGEAKTTDGPKNVGSYVWIETKNWPMWEHRLVEGPYIHHVSGIYGHYGEILMEACKYIPGLTPDIVEPSEAALRQRWM